MNPWMPDVHEYYDAIKAAQDAEKKAKAENILFWAQQSERVQRRSEEIRRNG